MNAAEHLDAMLSHCPRMLEISQELLAGKDGALMLSSAARLITAGATAALAQLRVSQGETRHRSIVERVNGGLPGLNPNFSGSPRFTPERAEELRKSITSKVLDRRSRTQRR